MRHADMPGTSVEMVVAASPTVVWRLVTDINVPARFSSEFQGGEWVEGGGPALGSRFRGRQEHPAIGNWETTSVVVVCDSERAFGWAVGDAESPAAVWRFDLAPAGEGTLLRQSARFGPGRSGLTAAIEAMPEKEERIIERRLAEWTRNMEATVAGIKSLAEGAAAAGGGA